MDVEKIIKTITPAELKWLSDENTLYFKPFLKMTFLNLVERKILHAEVITRQPSKYDPVKNYVYVTLGENYDENTLLPHEAILTKPFNRKKDFPLLLTIYVRIVVEKVSLRIVKRKIKQSMVKREMIYQGLFNWFSGFHLFTELGVKVKKHLNVKIERWNSVLPGFIENHPAWVLNLGNKLNGYLFLQSVLEDEALDVFFATGNLTGLEDNMFVGLANDDWRSSFNSSFDFGIGCGSTGCSSGGCSGCGGGGCSGCGGCGGCGS